MSLPVSEMSELARHLQDATISRSQLVYSRLKELIRSRALVPGQRIREAEIADMTKVSRTPVREAMNRLISEGLLALNPIRGFAVAELDKQQVLELYALREFLEGASARLAAQHASGPELTALFDLLEESRRIDGDNYERHAAVNREFHARISEAAHNRYLQRALAQMSDSLTLVPGTTFEMKGRAEEVYVEHRAVIDAMENRDADRAEAAAREHIRKAGEVRLRLLFGRY
jgi:DNA-binding GntR family transcriptional regulator